MLLWMTRSLLPQGLMMDCRSNCLMEMIPENKEESRLQPCRSLISWTFSFVYLKPLLAPSQEIFLKSRAGAT